MGYLLSIVRNKVINGKVQKIQYSSDVLRIDLPDDEYVASIHLSDDNGMELLSLPLELMTMPTSLIHSDEKRNYD